MTTLNTTAVLFAVVDALNTGLAAVAAPTWTAYDGPTVTTDTPGTYLIVGSDGQGNSYNYTQGWHSEGLQPERDESGTIHCQVVSHNGDGVTTTARGLVRDALADLAAVVQGINVTTVIEVHLGTAQIAVRQVPTGVEVEALVDLSYTGLLTTWP